MLRFLNQAIESNSRPRKTANDSILLRHGTQYKVLVNTSGGLTKSGQEYQRLTDSTLETFSYDPQQTPKRVGNQEFIKTRGGKERLVRNFDPTANDGQGKFKYTQIGKRYYANKKTEYIVRVPAIFKGTRANGQEYSREGLFPIHQPISVPANYTQAQRDAHIKLHVTNDFEDNVIAEFSQESIIYNPDSPWSVIEMTTSPESMSSPDIVERPLGVCPGSVSALPFAEAIIEEAYSNRDDKLCCIRQIAAVTKLLPDEIESAMDDCEEAIYGTSSWREKGVTSRMIFEFAKRTDRGCCLLHNGTAIEMLPGKNALVYAILENHAYFYGDMNIRKKLMKRIDPIKTKIKRQANASTTPDALAWLPFTWPPVPGHFWVYDGQIDFVRGQFLRDNRHPKVILKDESSTKSLVYIFSRADSEKGTCVIHAMPQDAQDMIQWLKNLDIGLVYRGEGLPSLTYKVLNKLIKEKERTYLNGEEKHELLEANGYACASCGDRGKVEFDHTIRFSQSYGDSKPDAPRCRECHATKTSEEPKEFETCPLESNLDAHVWEQYVKSERLPPLIYKNEQRENPSACMIADVIRCRMRALLLNVHPIPVFSPLDTIVPVNDHVLGDLNYVTRKAGNFIKLFGYTGPNWTHRILTEWLLYTGVIQWSDISCRLTATAHLPPDLLKKPLEKMEAAWGEIGLQKIACNAMIGTWMLDESYSYSLMSSNDAGDAPANALKRVIHYDGGNVVDYVTRTHMRSVTTLRPLHDLCMSTEAVRVGQMLYCLQKQKAIIYEIKTDSVLYKLKKKADVLQSLTFKDLKVRERFEANNCLNQHYDPLIPDSDLPVYRVAGACERDLLKMDPKMPTRNQALSLPAMVWNDLTPEDAERCVIQGGNLLVQGIAGTGKSYLCLKLVEKLRSIKKRVDIIAKTHTASARVYGCTADHYVRRSILHGCCNADVIWVEEFSQIETSLWAQLNKANVQWILSGDLNQFGALFDSWRGDAVPEGKLAESRFFHRLTGGNRLTLTTCRRSDSFLFDFYSSLIHGGSRFHLPLNDLLNEARNLFDYEGICENNLVISHAKRKRINRQVNLALKPEGAIFVKAVAQKGQLNAAQNMWIYVGINLLGCMSGVKKGIRNNVLYTITKIEDDTVTLKGDEEIKLSFAQVQQLTRLSFARTFASCQGTEFDTALCLHDTNHRHFTRRHLFVGMSRCKDKRLLAIV